jgi:hypothetical protein
MEITAVDSEIKTQGRNICHPPPPTQKKVTLLSNFNIFGLKKALLDTSSSRAAVCRRLALHADLQILPEGAPHLMAQ